MGTSKKQNVPDNDTTTETESQDEVNNHFKDIPKDFLVDLTDIIDELKITDFQSALDFDVDELTEKLVRKGRKNELVIQLLRQWRKALLEAIEQQRRIEEEISRKKRSRRPIWRCAVCGRASNPGCPVAPYIYGYQDIDTGEVFSTLTS